MALQPLRGPVRRTDQHHQPDDRLCTRRTHQDTHRRCRHRFVTLLWLRRTPAHDVRARGSRSTQPTGSDCATSATRLAGLFTYGDGQSATSPPDVRLTSFLRSDNPTGGACSSTNRCYLSPSTETSTYASGSAQLQGITRTGSSLVVAHDALGRRSYDYDNFDPTRSRRDYTYLPGGQLGTISGRTPGNAPYTVTMRYDERGRPIVVSSTIGDSYELFWDDVDRLISVQITPIGPRGTAPQILSIRWHYHYGARPSSPRHARSRRRTSACSSSGSGPPWTSAG